MCVCTVCVCVLAGGGGRSVIGCWGRPACGESYLTPFFALVCLCARRERRPCAPVSVFVPRVSNSRCPPPPPRTARASAFSTRHLKILVNPTLSQLSQTSDIRHRPCPHRQSSSCRRYSPPHGHRSPSLIGPADGSLLGGRFSTDPRLRALRANHLWHILIT